MLTLRSCPDIQFNVIVVGQSTAVLSAIGPDTSPFGCVLRPLAAEGGGPCTALCLDAVGRMETGACPVVQSSTRSACAGRPEPTLVVESTLGPQQVHRGAFFRMLTFERLTWYAGQSGLGKSTMVNTIFASHLVDSKGRFESDEPIRQTTEIQAVSHSTSPRDAPFV